MEEKNVRQLYQAADRRLALNKPVPRRLWQKTRDRQEIAEAEARERQQTALADEDTTVRSIVAMVGVYPEDAADHLIRDLTAAEIRYVVRAAYRHGRSSRG